MAPGVPGARALGRIALAAALALPGASRSQPRPASGDLEPGKLLVASRALRDPNFRETVVLIVEYARPTGAVGLVINRPSAVDLATALPELEGAGEGGGRVFIGGPVEPMRFTLLIRSAAEPERADRVFADIFMSSSRELLERLVSAPGAGETFRAYAGYAGWAPGQLEAELAVGGWHVVDGRSSIVFELPPDKIWSRLILVGSAEMARLKPPEAPGQASIVGEGW